PGGPLRGAAPCPVLRGGSVLGRAGAAGAGTQGGRRLGALRPVGPSSRPSTVTPPWGVWISPATPGRCDEPGPLRLCGGFLAALADRGPSVRGLAAVRRQSSGTAEAGAERVFRRRTCGGRA